MTTDYKSVHQNSHNTLHTLLGHNLEEHTFMEPSMTLEEVQFIEEHNYVLFTTFNMKMDQSFHSLPVRSQLGMPPDCIAASVASSILREVSGECRATYLNYTSDKWNTGINWTENARNGTMEKSLLAWKLAMYHKTVWREEKKDTGRWDGKLMMNMASTSGAQASFVSKLEQV